MTFLQIPPTQALLMALASGLVGLIAGRGAGKGIIMTAGSNAILQTLTDDLPVLIAGTRAIAKSILDLIDPGQSADAKAATLTQMLRPAFDAELARLTLPAWALAMLDTVFVRLVDVVVSNVEAQ